MPLAGLVYLNFRVNTEKKDGAKTVPFENRFEKWRPLSFSKRAPK